MKHKSLILIGIMIVVIAGVAAFFGYTPGHDATTNPEAGSHATTTAASAPAPTSSTSSPSLGEISWTFKEVSSDDPATGPKTTVSLRVKSTGKTYDFGTFSGSCASIEGSSWQLLDNEKAGAICWWAGGGSEIGIFAEDGKLIAKSGDVDEGTAETGGFRGNFRTLLEIK